MNTSRIIKLRTQTKFAQVPNEALRLNTLSLTAKGLLSLLLSLPDDWVIYKKSLYSFVSEKRYAVDKAFTELEKANYVQIKKSKDDKGRFKTDYIVSAEPLSSSVGFSATDVPAAGISTSDKTAPTNKEVKQTNNNKEKKETNKDLLSNSKDFDFYFSVIDSGEELNVSSLPQQLKQQLIDCGVGEFDKERNVIYKQLPF